LKKIVLLQRAVRRILKHRHAVKTYLSRIPPNLNEQDAANVQTLIEKYGPFEYLNAKKESEMNFWPKLEYREAQTIENGAIYCG